MRTRAYTLTANDNNSGAALVGMFLSSLAFSEDVSTGVGVFGVRGCQLMDISRLWRDGREFDKLFCFAGVAVHSLHLLRPGFFSLSIEDILTVVKKAVAGQGNATGPCAVLACIGTRDSPG